MKGPKTWILVADGGHGRLYECTGKGQDLHLLRDEEASTAHAFSREIASDRPGRSFESAGPGARHAMEEPTDPKRHAEHEFVRDLAGILKEGLDRHAYDRLVVIAPPKALGDLREVMDDQVAAHVAAEIDKDLVKASPDKLVPYLEQAL